MPKPGSPASGRPEHKELHKKLRLAREILVEGDFLAADFFKLAANFHELGLYDQDEQRAAIEKCFEEIRPEQYCGRRPPEKSYERTTTGMEMYAFAWDSGCFRRAMYLKFSIRVSGGKSALYLYSLHPDRPRKGRNSSEG